MTGREQERRRRRGDTSGGSPSRRGADRARRPDRTDRAAQSRTAREPMAAPYDQDHDGTEPAVDLTEPAEPAGYAGPGRVAGRAGARVRRGSAFSRALGRLTTRRAAMLALVVCALALSVAVPLHTYLTQRADLAAQLQQQQALHDREAVLERRQQELADPAQVEAEARSRLHYVLPGQTPYVVQLPGSVPPPDQHQADRQVAPSGTWYQTLWNSVVATG